MLQFFGSIVASVVAGVILYYIRKWLDERHKDN
jgi:fructose-specific phosphotransferase system IIC component